MDPGVWIYSSGLEAFNVFFTLTWNPTFFTFKIKKWGHYEVWRTLIILISYSVFVVEDAQEMLTTIMIIIGYEPWISYLFKLFGPLCPYL